MVVQARKFLINSSVREINPVFKRNYEFEFGD